MNNLIPADFLGTQVQIIDYAGQKWLTAEQIGHCLGYNEANASQGVRNLYNRHADEFTDADTCQIKLSWQGQGREIRVFSGTGCHKLGFFASTPRAKEFRTWASRVLAGQPPALPAPQTGELALARELGSLKDMIAAQSQAILALYNRLDTAQRGHIRAVTALMNLHKQQATREAIETVIRMEAAGKPRAEIVAATGKTFNHVRQIVFRARRDGLLPPEDAGQMDLALAA